MTHEVSLKYRPVSYGGGVGEVHVLSSQLYEMLKELMPLRLTQ